MEWQSLPDRGLQRRRRLFGCWIRFDGQHGYASCQVEVSFKVCQLVADEPGYRILDRSHRPATDSGTLDGFGDKFTMTGSTVSVYNGREAVCAPAKPGSVRIPC